MKKLRLELKRQNVLLPSNPSTPVRFLTERRFMRTINLYHFAYLRVVAEGLNIAESAARYLHITDTVDTAISFGIDVETASTG